ncbi:hypothetical protein ACK8OR_13450 [Jannaschia sp. KMU-145]|uniref:hypothetical protein n=1 Tax=Jannaschia halovivens TaxID=3388667 RepID=UPI00396B39B5
MPSVLLSHRKELRVSVPDLPDTSGLLLLSEEEWDALSPDDQVENLVNWFLVNYEDPANELPYNGREGGYQWINGESSTAESALSENFNIFVADEIISAAVSKIEDDWGIYEWSPASDRSQIESEVPPLEIELKSQLDQLIVQLESLKSPAGLGHNHPPARISDSPMTNDEIDEAIVAATTLASATGNNAVTTLETHASLRLLQRTSIKVGSWLGARATIGADALVKSTATVAGAKIVVSWDEVQMLLENAIKIANMMF